MNILSTYHPDPALHAIEAGWRAWRLARRRGRTVLWSAAVGLIVVQPDDRFVDVMRRHRRARRKRFGESMS